MSHTSLSRLLLPVALVSLSVLATSCGAEGSNRADAEAVVAEFVEGWQLASGPQRDDFAATTIRRLLSDSLAERADSLIAGGSSAPAGRRLDVLYNEFMHLDIPHDHGYEITEVTSDGDDTVVTVRLLYTNEAAGAAAAAGVIPFERVTEVYEQVAPDPTRLFTMRQVGGHWRIVDISAP